MDVKKVEIIEKYVISEGTRKLTHKQKIKAAEDMFKEKYQGKILPYKVLEKDMFVKINSKTRQNFSAHLKREGNKAHYDKLSVTIDGNYIKMISNPTYEKTLKEKKPNQSKIHKEGQLYHYFKKAIMIDNQLYMLIINVAERTNNNCYVHFVEIKK